MKAKRLLFLLFLSFLGSAYATAGEGSVKKSVASVIEERSFVVGDSKVHFLDLYLTGKSKGYFYYEEYTKQILPAFRGRPYGSGGHKCPSAMTLVNLNKFDCVTLVETYWALAYTLYEIQSNQVPEEFSDPFVLFVRNIERIRYFGGENCGIEERIHYFTQEMLELERAGLMINVAAANGDPYKKRINYISTHEAQYGLPNMSQIRSRERILSKSDNYYYPIRKVEKYIPLAENGDIISFASRTTGLDVSHCGIITKEGDRLKLTHASSKYEKVMVEQDFLSYIYSRTKINGIFVFRPVFRPV